MIFVAPHLSWSSHHRNPKIAKPLYLPCPIEHPANFDLISLALTIYEPSDPAQPYTIKIKTLSYYT